MDVRKLIPREPPEGFLAWAAETMAGELDTYGMLYEQEWVEDWGLDTILDEWAKLRKRRMVRVEYSEIARPRPVPLRKSGRLESGRLRICPPGELRRSGGRHRLRGRREYPVPQLRLAGADPQTGRSPEQGLRCDVRSQRHERRRGGGGALLVLTCWVLQRIACYGGGGSVGGHPGGGLCVRSYGVRPADGLAQRLQRHRRATLWSTPDPGGSQRTGRSGGARRSTSMA